MDGIIYVLKPPKMTSHDVVSYFRRLFNIKKIGHTGTLDPDASGVLPICIGRGTKISQFLTSTTKKYRAELKLGITTDTQDASGKIISQKDVNVIFEQVEKIAKSFVGTIRQIPPMYSAIKINGKKLYELAREGQTIERKEREVQIYDLEIINYNESEKTILFDVECSKGTYIRTLCNDIGDTLGVGGHMSLLIRTFNAGVDIKDCLTLDQITQYYNNNQIDKFLVPLDEVFSEYSKLTLKDESQRWVQNGCVIYQKDVHQQFNFGIGDSLRIYDEKNKFLALYKAKKDDRCIFLEPEKMFL